ncbi:MAG: RagB/SusD family nutrient uptake outer membrane protein [Ginsengibacter sp.]
MKYIYSFIIACIAISFVGCKKFLDRPSITVVDDETAWTNELNVRLYVNKYYTSFFPGYGLGWGTAGAPLLNYQFSDDVFMSGNPSNFTRAVPNTGSWSYSTIRSVNILISRLNERMTGVLTEESFDHWMGIGRFLRALEYSKLVLRYGDVPYYDYVVADTDKDALYKPRTPRNEVMDHVYNDLKFAMEKVRISDGDQYLNRYAVAGLVSSTALMEASWQKYYYNNNDRAKKFFELAEDAANVVIASGKFDIVTDFRTLFTSNNLAGNRDVLLYRHYDAAAGITHAVASNCAISVSFGPTTDLIKSFVCVDGQAWQNSSVTDASDFSLSNMIQTRDSRLEATFYEKPNAKSVPSYWYVNKFIPRAVAEAIASGGVTPAEFSGDKNETDYPVLRYSEVLLNWIEARAELGKASQSDIDRSINKIRNRPIAPGAIAKGVKKTAALNLAMLPNDPARDADVSPLLWEIRRERRMEFAFEQGRYEDLRRWKKLEKMDTQLNPDIVSGGWVNFPSEMPGDLVKSKE